MTGQCLYCNCVAAGIVQTANGKCGSGVGNIEISEKMCCYLWKLLSFCLKAELNGQNGTGSTNPLILIFLNNTTTTLLCCTITIYNVTVIWRMWMRQRKVISPNKEIKHWLTLSTHKHSHCRNMILFPLKTI